MSIRDKIFINISIILLTLCYYPIGYCGDSKMVILENKILSNASKDSVESSYKLFAAFAAVDDLSVDEALNLCIRLSDYYLGAGGTELYLEKTTKIGERILPFLVRKKNMPIDCKGKYIKICRSLSERNYLLGLAINAIKEGIVIHSVFPDNLNIEAKDNLKIIDIFLEDYKRAKNHFPKDLRILREYAWGQYGYKLRVLNPWGQPYKYTLVSSKDYILEIGNVGPKSDQEPVETMPSPRNNIPPESKE